MITNKYDVFVKMLTELDTLKNNERIFPRTIRAREKKIRSFCDDNGMDYEYERMKYYAEKKKQQSALW